MASNSSGTLSPSQTYTLGEYLFRLIVLYDNNVTSIQCNATHGTEHAQTGIDLSGIKQVKSWYVDASERTADVYATLNVGYLDTSPINKPIPSAESGVAKSSDLTHTYFFSIGSGQMTNVYVDAKHLLHLYASASAGARITCTSNGSFDYYKYLTSTFTHQGKTVYYNFEVGAVWENNVTVLSPACNGGAKIGTTVIPAGAIAWIMIYGDPSEDEGAKQLIARFEIDIADAGGTSWDDPGSTGDASKTLEVTVTGALSGRHNDPLTDTSYAYTPSDQDAATVYGSGGDGGYGGGGGAGASTVIIHTIATERAGSVDYTAKAKRHGYGSGGGKGGKGGDGCILVYY